MKIVLFLIFALSFSANATDLTKYCENSEYNKCITPYGEVLGESKGNAAYSNCRAECVNPIENTIHDKVTKKDIFTGLKWQCVEFARRWWISQKNITFGSVETANEIFEKLVTAKNIKSGKKVQLAKFKNNSITPPKSGDLLIYKKSVSDNSFPYGHVAVIVNVNIEKGFVDLAEANYTNNYWEVKDQYARRIVLISKANKYKIYDLGVNEFKETSNKEKAAAVILGWVQAKL